MSRNTVKTEYFRDLIKTTSLKRNRDKSKKKYPGIINRLTLAVIHIVKGKSKEKYYAIDRNSQDKDYGSIEIGRSSEKKPKFISFPSLNVSRSHAKIVCRDKKIFITNLSKTNPTKVDSIIIPSNGYVNYNEGSRIEVGDIIFTIELIRPWPI